MWESPHLTFACLKAEVHADVLVFRGAWFHYRDLVLSGAWKETVLLPSSGVGFLYHSSL